MGHLVLVYDSFRLVQIFKKLLTRIMITKIMELLEQVTLQTYFSLSFCRMHVDSRVSTISTALFISKPAGLLEIPETRINTFFSIKEVTCWSPVQNDLDNSIRD